MLSAERSPTFSTSPLSTRLRNVSTASTVMSLSRDEGFRLALGAVMDHATARCLDRSLRAGESLANAAEAARRDLVRLEVDVHAVGEFEAEREVVHDFHVLADRRAAIADRASRQRPDEPMQDVEVVAILFDDDVAGIIAIGEPVAQLMNRGIVVGPEFPRVSRDPGSGGHRQLAELSGLEAAIGLQISLAVTLLKTGREAFVGFVEARRPR